MVHEGWARNGEDMRVRVWAGILALTLGGLITGLAPATSAVIPIAPVRACAGSGTLYVTAPLGGSPATWKVQGSGSCPAQLDGAPPETMSLTGTGTSDNLGLCSTTLLVTNLHLDVAVTFQPVIGSAQTEQQVWSSPVSVFPNATPFLISGPPGRLGAGVVLSRLILDCGNNGTSPAANFAWAQTK